jgi:hypothetical protein
LSVLNGGTFWNMLRLNAPIVMLLEEKTIWKDIILITVKK